jgi:hypothetical protein
MTRRFSTPILVAALALANACSDGVAPPVAPLSAGPDATSASVATKEVLPGEHRAANPNQNVRLVRCDFHDAYAGSADIGPRGGILRVGPHILIVPPGALTRTTRIWGDAPAGETVEIKFRVDFGPEGQQFRKPAGLLLNAQGCDIPEYYPPDVVYLSPTGEVLERIDAVYSNYWHTVAAPIEHFSGYALAW